MFIFNYSGDKIHGQGDTAGYFIQLVNHWNGSWNETNFIQQSNLFPHNWKDWHLI